MKPLLSLSALVVLSCSLLAQNSYEEPPVLNASEILRPEFLQGPGYKVREAVPTYAGTNLFVIDSDFGPFEADGNAMLIQRVREIQAIAELKKLSSSSEYVEAVKLAGKGTYETAKQLVTNPVDTVSGLPKGLWKFMNRAGQNIKEAGKRERSDYEDNAVIDMIGFSKAKRALALRFGIDPYSTNKAFQTELNRIAWASFAGQMTIGSVSMVATGGAGVALSALNISDTLQNVLRDSSPIDLRIMNDAALKQMGVGSTSRERFLNNAMLSPTHQTLIVKALQTQRGVIGRNTFVSLAGSAVDESEANFYTSSAVLISRQKDLARITSFNQLPLCVAKDGTVILALQWDYASWTQPADKFLTALQQSPVCAGKPLRICLSGQISPLGKQQLTARKIQFAEMQQPGPLR